MKPRINISSEDSLADEVIGISITDLPASSPITVRATITGDTGEIFQSHAQYVSSNFGKVDVATDCSLEGSYEGIDSMGLLWSMKPAKGQRLGLRLSKRDVTKPYMVKLEVFSGNDEEPKDLITMATFRRHFMSKGVRRIPIREGRIRGTLFVPQGNGPFPAIMDMFGTAGGLIEFKAALLASHGFLAFALAYFDYDDLPKVVTEIKLEYFEEAAHWLASHELAIPHGIALMGVSKGTELVLTLASYQPNLIKAIVAISPAHAIVAIPLMIRGKPSAFIKFEPEFTKMSEKGVLQWGDTYPDTITTDDLSTIHPAMVAVERIECPVMLVCGEDDKSWKSCRMGELIKTRMEKHGRGEQCTLLCYHGTGHLIEPPYSPHCGFSYHKAYRMCVAWGGEAKAHAHASVDSWNKILTFFRRNLSIKSRL
ncbi:predicted protein [Nematostella vectensis]|uniref:Uncharacterized protein n=1 Tax=Nematostella vectensis TaxID=45351 RepID=A7SNB9_NEMVE|nr:predicted protein [Nematostella vectensis]|eukprot:XP_001626925.1 predicted protein [Nematostella vectensis]